MIELDLPAFRKDLRLKREGERRFLFDPIRRKWLVLQPEELVRQLLVQYLMQEKGYNRNRINIEKGLKVNELDKRCDVLVYDRSMAPFLLVECKAPAVNVSQETFRQIAMYNFPLKVPFLLVTNGAVTYCCRMDYQLETFEFLDGVPDYPG